MHVQNSIASIYVSSHFLSDQMDQMLGSCTVSSTTMSGPELTETSSLTEIQSFTADTVVWSLHDQTYHVPPLAIPGA